MKINFIIIGSLTTTALQAQDSKFYLGIGVGYSTASGDMADSDQYGAESGVNLKFIDMVTDSMKLGVLLLLGSSGWC